jgi:hypothetical protein
VDPVVAPNHERYQRNKHHQTKNQLILLQASSVPWIPNRYSNGR